LIEEFAVELVGAVGGIARERHAGAGRVARVAEHHRLHVDRGAPLGGDVVLAAIDDRAVVHPGAEHGAGGAAQLIPRIVREHLAGALLDQRLEALDELLLVGGGELRVLDVGVVVLVLELVNDGLERLVIFAFALLHAEHDVAVHLDEAAVAVPRETLVAASRSTSASTVSSLRPRFRMVSIMPGIESRAPERTATRSGMPSVAPNFVPMIFSMLATPASI
jgi:hypothetical protein